MKYKIQLLALITLALFACRKDKSKVDGPSISEIFSDFKVAETFKCSKDSVNFNTGETAFFTARFNKIVKWTITIQGNTSKAVKIINGESKAIDVSNSSWNGSTTVFPMFAKEFCLAKLTIKDVTDSFTTTVRISNTKKLEGVIVADFETGLNAKWTRFAQSGANMDFQIKTDAFAPQGKSYLNMAGTVNWDYLIGLIDFPGNAYGTAPTFPLPTNPESVYFNCLIYGVNNTNTSLVLFQFKEDENADGIINANNEDEYDYQVTVDWVGWKLISIKYSDIVTLVNGSPATAKGNALHNPDKIGKISMLHLANPSNGFASSKLDLMMFTLNKPLEP